MAERLRTKLLPGSPETIDASELFMLALPSAFDAQWLAALSETQLTHLVALLVFAAMSVTTRFGLSPRFSSITNSTVSAADWSVPAMSTSMSLIGGVQVPLICRAATGSITW